MTHRVVVVGAGFGGLAVARQLRRPDVQLTVVDANNFHTFQPLLYQVATAGLDADDVAYPIRHIFHGRDDVEVVMARVTGADLDARFVRTDRAGELAYDTLVLACGAIVNTFSVPGVDEHAFGLKHLSDALAVKAHLLDRFESAATDAGLIDDGALDVVVCGGGPTGVEMAGGLAELYQRVLAKDFPGLPLDRARITLVEPMDRVLVSFSDPSSTSALAALRSLGVTVRLGVGVDSVEPTRVRLADGTELRAHTTVWATGVRADPLAAEIGLPTGRGGRVEITDDLTVVGRPEVFAIGDVAASRDRHGDVLPQVAQPAIQAGKHVAHQIARRLDGAALQPFRYVDKGSMATIGRHAAVAELPIGIRLHGFTGWLAWLGLHLLYLMGFRNRINVFVNWCWNYLTYDRASRLLGESARPESGSP